MPRSKKSPKTASSNIMSSVRQSGANPIVTDAGQTLNTYTTNGTSGNSVVLLTPDGLTNRTAQLGESYNLYRYAGLEVEMFSNSAIPAGGLVVAVMLDAIDSTSATTFTPLTASQLPYSMFASATTSVSTKLVLKRKDLLGRSAANWFKTNANSGADSWDEVHLTLLISNAAGSATPVYLMIRWILEFTDPAPPSLLPRPFIDLANPCSRRTLKPRTQA